MEICNQNSCFCSNQLVPTQIRWLANRYTWKNESSKFADEHFLIFEIYLHKSRRAHSSLFKSESPTLLNINHEHWQSCPLLPDAPLTHHTVLLLTFVWNSLLSSSCSRGFVRCQESCFLNWPNNSQLCTSTARIIYDLNRQRFSASSLWVYTEVTGP